MQLSLPQLHYLHQLLGGPFTEEDFTAQDVITLRALVKKELATREVKAPLPTAIPADRAEIQQFIEEKGVTVMADLHGLKTERRARFINKAAEDAAKRRDQEALAAVDPADALKMLGLG